MWIYHIVSYIFTVNPDMPTARKWLVANEIFETSQSRRSVTLGFTRRICGGEKTGIAIA